MIHFFGILDPSNSKRHVADEAPGKRAFFGSAETAVKPIETAAPDERGSQNEARERQRFLLQSFAPQF